MTINRRQIIGAIAASLGASPMSTLANASSTRDRKDMLGCLFARANTTRVWPSDATVDFWMGRVSDFDGQQLPHSVNRILVWDDIFKHDDTRHEFQQILSLMQTYYGFDPSSGSNRFTSYLEGQTDLQSALCEIAGHTQSAEIAIIDISSCGPTTFDWHQVVPDISSSYRHVVGLEHLPGRGLRDWRSETGNPSIVGDVAFNSELALCETTLMTCDVLLFQKAKVEYEEMSEAYARLFQALVEALTSTRLIDDLAQLNTLRSFAIGLLPGSVTSGAEAIDEQRDLVREQMNGWGTNDNIVFKSGATSTSAEASIVFWPVRQGTVSS